MTRLTLDLSFAQLHALTCALEAHERAGDSDAGSVLTLIANHAPRVCERCRERPAENHDHGKWCMTCTKEYGRSLEPSDDSHYEEHA